MMETIFSEHQEPFDLDDAPEHIGMTMHPAASSDHPCYAKDYGTCPKCRAAVYRTADRLECIGDHFGCCDFAINTSDVMSFAKKIEAERSSKPPRHPTTDSRGQRGS